MVDLPESLQPLAFLLGTWRGEGVGGYPTIEADFRYGEQVTFAWYGKPVLEFRSESWRLDDGTAEPGAPMARQTGFWRPVANPDNPALPRLEVVLALPTGIVEVLYGGLVEGPSGTHVELASDLIAHTETAKQVDAEKRMYAVRGGKLMYAIEMAAMGQPMQAHLSAALDPVNA